ncbi:MAG: putative Ig domain-containing protein [Acidobacteriaceae bacterium]
MYVSDSKSSLKSNSGHVKVVAPLTITSTTLADGVVGSGYSTSLTATGGKHPYTWGAGSSLPPGLTLASSGAISGTPTQGGSYSFVATLSDNSTPSLTTSATITLNVTSGTSTLSATSQTLPGATTGKPYSATLTLSGGSSPYTWSASSSLPAGLTVSSAGAVSGTPTTAGTFSFSAKVKDSSSPAQNSSANYQLTVATAAAPLIVATTSLPGGTSGTSYSTTLSASGGTSPYTWAATTSLPAGLTLNSNGVLSGTPTTAGTSSIGVKVTDTASPTQTATATLSLSVAAPPAAPLAVTTTSVPNATSGQSYSVTLMASGGTTPYKWSATGLPAGVSMSSGGVISGTPTSSGTFSFTAKVTDSSSTIQSASKALSLTVKAAATTSPLSITTSTLPGGTVGSNYSATVQATGGTGAYTWNVASGALPSGVTLSATTGQLSGTPGTAAQYNFTLQVTDSASPANTASKSYSVTVGNSSGSNTGNPVISGPQHWPSTISYASLNQWQIPSTDADWWFEVNHLDAAHGQDHAVGILSRNPNFFFIKYTLLETTIQSGTGSDVPAMTTYCQGIGADPENAYLHYSTDTTIDMSACGGSTNTLIRGWGAGTATQRSQARVQSCIFSLPRYIWNHGDTSCLQPYMKNRSEQDINTPVSGSAHYRGLFYDEIGPQSNCSGSYCLGELLTPISGTGQIAELGNETKAQLISDGKFEAGFRSLETAIKTDLSSMTNGDSLTLPNTAQGANSSVVAIGKAADGNLTEWFDSEAQTYCSAGVECEWSFADSVVGNGSVLIWTEGDYNLPSGSDYTACNYNSALSRHQMWSIDNYWMIRSGNLVMYSQRPWMDANGNWGLLSAHWYKAQEYDIGTPVGPRYLWQTGTDASGNTYRIFRRDYTKGIVLVRGRSSWSDTAPRNSMSPKYGLGGTYHVLNSDGTLGGAISEVGVCRDEAVTLVP